MVAGLTVQQGTAERRAAALFDSRHNFERAQAEVAGLSVTPSRPVGTEDIRDLQGGVSHPSSLKPTATCSVTPMG